MKLEAHIVSGQPKFVDVVQQAKTYVKSWSDEACFVFLNLRQKT